MKYKLSHILFEDPDTVKLPDGKEIIWNRPARPFGYGDVRDLPNTNGMWVGGEGNTHYENDYGYTRERLKYPGRIWPNWLVISFWKYPSKYEMKRVLNDLSDAMAAVGSPVNFRDSRWLIEIKINKENEWPAFTCVPLNTYVKTGSLQLTPAELAKLHAMPPIEKARIKRALASGDVDKVFARVGGSYKLQPGWGKTNAERKWNRFRLRGEAKLIKEDPDLIRYKKTIEDRIERTVYLQYTDDGTYPFALLPSGDVWVGPEGDDHGSIGFSFGRRIKDKIKFPGRVWTKERVISFWDYPSRAELTQLLRGLARELHKEVYVNFTHGGWQLNTEDDELVDLKDWLRGKKSK